jgi:hypothetical protein
MDDGRYTEEQAAVDLQKYKDERKAYDERVKKIIPIHEDEVIIERIDMKELSTFLSMDPRAEKDRIRASWYGRILRISDVEGDFPVREKKKEMLRQQMGKVINYNPDSSYSLNVSGFYGIWVLSIDNVMNVDEEIDIIDLYKKLLEKRIGTFWVRN